MTYYHRNLPHWHPEGRSILLTWRLFGSLPRDNPAIGGAAAIVYAAPSGPPMDWMRSFQAVDAQLDPAAFGPAWLRQPEIADAVQKALLRGAELHHYELHAFVIMPNHVHVLLSPMVPLARITHGVKGVSARHANASLGRTGRRFWQDESFDHWIRNSAEFERIRHYIEWNPVKANLAAKPENWKWSSACGTATPGCAKTNPKAESAQARVPVPPE